MFRNIKSKLKKKQVLKLCNNEGTTWWPRISGLRPNMYTYISWVILHESKSTTDSASERFANGFLLEEVGESKTYATK